MEDLKKLFDQYKVQVLGVMPYSEIEHVGSSAIPDIDSKGDLDIQIRVAMKDLDRAIIGCDKLFIRRYENLWTNEFAMFTDPKQQIKIDIMLTVKDSAYDSFFRIRDAMIENQTIRQRYIDFKKQYSDFTSDQYRKAKHTFFRQLEAELGLKVRPMENFPSKI